ncbi:hypothetical protein [Natronomonas gomsonensis]|uniref:hypothetical protein n=1 Tax=Natronomonas gomsonensis TaxID=1046043 RepID=UPI0015BCBEF5|nr:hypothetical protein [Natronomonas gomsonensis]
MALRLLLAFLGLLEVAFPKPLVDFWMNLATEDDDVELRPWVYTAARIEGVLILLYVLWRRRDGE